MSFFWCYMIFTWLMGIPSATIFREHHAGDNSRQVIIMAWIFFIFSPIITPIRIGFLIYDTKDD